MRRLPLRTNQHSYTRLRASFLPFRSFSVRSTLKIDSVPIPDTQPSSGSIKVQGRWSGFGQQEPLKETEERAEMTNGLPDEVPNAPPYPCPWITSDDEKWLKPLYQRGWRILRSQNNPQGVGSFALEKQLRFKTHKSTIEFLNDLMGLEDGICEREGHHPFGLHLTYSGILLTLKTTCAKIFSSEPKERSIRKAGVTLRDIRLAIFIERRLEEIYQIGDVPKLVHVEAPGLMDVDLGALRIEQLDVARQELETGAKELLSAEASKASKLP